MKTEEVLGSAPVVLSAEQRADYFRDGYLVLPGFVSEQWLGRLWQVTNEFIEHSRRVSRSDDVFDLEPGHCADTPRLRRLSYPSAQHPLYWEFASQGPVVDIAQDLLGPNVVFHHSKLNFKWAGGGEEVKWHQDFPFYPHTGRSVLAIGLYMADVDDQMGPMGAIPGSQNGKIYNHYDKQGAWAGALQDEEINALPKDGIGWMKGRAGTVTVHNVATVHGSMPNHSVRMRPLFINAYAAADTLPLTPYPGSACEQNGTLIRGERQTIIPMSAETCRLPPDWSGGYTSIFDLQQVDNAS